MTAPTLFLARHGQSAWNRCKRVTGQLDPDLAPEGRAQARELAALFQEVELRAIYASDLARSRETAQVVADAQGLEVQVVPGLREQHFGALQGRFRDGTDPEAEALWRARKADPVGFRAEGGETFGELADRVTPIVRTILAAHPGSVTLIVGHRNTNRAILAALLGWSPSVAVSFPVGHDCVYRVGMDSPPGVSAIRFSRIGRPTPAARP